MIRVFLSIVIIFFSACNEKNDDQLRAEAYKVREESKKAFYESIEKEKNPWQVRASIQPGDTNHVLMLKYKDEIGLTVETVYCMAIFESAREYKLVAPWIHTDIRVQKSNVLGDELSLIDKKQIKYAYLPILQKRVLPTY